MIFNHFDEFAAACFARGIPATDRSQMAAALGRAIGEHIELNFAASEPTPLFPEAAKARADIADARRAEAGRLEAEAAARVAE